MSLSMREQVLLLPQAEQEEFFDSLDAETLAQIARDEWWWVARPEQVPPPGNWSICLMLAGRGFGKTRSGAEWLVQRAIDHPYDMSGFPTERMVLAYNLSDAVASCAEGPSGVIRVLQRRGFQEVTRGRKYDDPVNKYAFVKSPKPYIRLLETGSIIHFTGASPDAARSKNLADVWCVAKGELVATARGPVPIESVVIGDWVRTTQGFSRVVSAGCTKRDAKVLRILTDVGTVRVTPDHQVWANGAWLRADQVRVGDSMITCLPQVNQSPVKPQPSMNGTGKPGITTSVKAASTAATASCCTEPSGSPHMVPSLMGMTSIISTGSDGIAGHQTCNLLENLNIPGSPGDSAQIPTDSTPWVAQGVPATALETCGQSESPRNSSVLNVGVSSYPRECEPNSVQLNARESIGVNTRAVSVLSVEPEEETTDVYDLTVFGVHEFFAGTGFLKIHNCDEPIKWSAPEETWKEGIRPALRADVPGDKPRALITTTPKPLQLLRNWVNDQVKWKVHVVRGSTFDNANNLSEDSVDELREMYEGTALGRQELYGELLDDIQGALFNFSDIHHNRVEIGPEKVTHRCVGVDPGLTGDEDADEMGVIVASRDHQDHMFIVADRTVRLAGREAALYAWRIFEEYQCDTLVYEENLGKVWMNDVFTDTFRELQRAGVFPAEVTTPPLKPVFSKHGKQLRAEPVAVRYGQGRVHHIGTFSKLEDQMLSFDPLSSKASPDRLDALVHACRHLIEGERRKSRIISPARIRNDRLAVAVPQPLPPEVTEYRSGW